MKRIILAAAAAVALPYFAVAVPQLARTQEIVANGELKARVLAGASGVPAPTLQNRQYKMTKGGVSTDVKLYVPRDVWFLRAFAGEWKDKRGNVMRIARVISLLPALERDERLRLENDEWFKEEIDKGLDEMEEKFKGTDEELESWKSLWNSGDKRTGTFFQTKDGARYYVDFKFAEKVSDKELKKLFKEFTKSVSSSTRGVNKHYSSMKWWEQTNDHYKFLTDLDQVKGGKFIKDAMRLMEAMRKSYEFYVPPTNSVGVCTVRVFKTLDGYREYRASTGEDDQMSCGLWDPSREELLVAAEDVKKAQNTMRHEAFHQYLHYATKRGDHAMWFNEGHACFFENVKYIAAKNEVKVLFEGDRSVWVVKDPQKYANAIKSVITKNREQFYSGDVNLNYCTAWAICYFLEKGAYTSDYYAPYRQICPKYLEMMSQGASAADATAAAWEVVADRDVAADFLKFWKEKRLAAEKVR